MAELKSLDQFSNDVRRGDLIRIVFSGNSEITGYAHAHSPLDGPPSEIIINRVYPFYNNRNSSYKIRNYDHRLVRYEILRRKP